MNLLDENIIESQRQALRGRRIAVRQIGVDAGYKGMSDHDVLPLLHGLSRPTFFTRDDHFYDRRLCHRGYCLVFLDVSDDEVAAHVALTLRHPELNTWAERAGIVARVSTQGICLWGVHGENEVDLRW